LGQSFFPGRVIELTKKQLEIIHYIRFYESIYELDDFHRPAFRVIEDDEECDRWYKNFKFQQEQKTIEHFSRIENKKVGIPIKASKTVGE